MMGVPSRNELEGAEGAVLGLTLCSRVVLQFEAVLEPASKNGSFLD